MSFFLRTQTQTTTCQQQYLDIFTENSRDKIESIATGPQFLAGNILHFGNVQPGPVVRTRSGKESRVVLHVC